jgi:hypothetical protein
LCYTIVGYPQPTPEDVVTHVQIAEDLAHKSLNGDYGDELMRHRWALVAQVHATLGLIEAVEKLTDASS